MKENKSERNRSNSRIRSMAGRLSAVVAVVSVLATGAQAQQGRFLMLTVLNAGTSYDIVRTNEDGSNPVTVLNGASDERFCDVSRDGSTILYQSDATGKVQLYKMAWDGSGKTQLTFSGNNMGARFSPNGTKIVYMHNVNGEAEDLFVADANASNPVNITNSPGVLEAGPDWNRATNRVVCSRGSLNGGVDLYSMNPDGSALQQVTANGGDEWYSSWSFDGQWVAFHGVVNNNWEILAVDKNGGNQRNLTNFPLTADQAPCFGPENQVYFCRYGDVYKTDLNGAAAQRVTSLGTNVSIVRFVLEPAPFVLGDYVLFGNLHDYNIRRIDMATMQSVVIVPTDGEQRAEDANSLTNRLVFTRYRFLLGETKQLWLTDFNGTSPKQLTFGGYSDEARLSPDGSKVIYCFSANNADRVIKVLDLGTNQTTTVMGDPTEIPNSVAWMPNGDGFLYAANKDGFLKWIHQNNAVQPLWNYGAWKFRIAPDGKSIVYPGPANGGYYMQVLNLASGNVQVGPGYGLAAFAPVPDGSVLYSSGGLNQWWPDTNNNVLLSADDYAFGPLAHKLPAPPVALRPTAFRVDIGTLESGNLASLFNNDQSYLTVRSAVINNPLQAPITVTGYFTSPVQNPLKLTFTLRGHSSRTGLYQEMMLYNFVANKWDRVDFRYAPIYDATVTANTATPSNYVRTGTKAVWARWRLSRTNGSQSETWRTYTDRVAVTVTR